MRSIQRSDGRAVLPRSRMLTLFLLALLAATVAISCVLLGGRQFVLQQYYDQLEHMEREVADLEAEVARARAAANKAGEDYLQVEKVVREKMNYSAPGEVIFRFEKLD